MPRIEKKLFAIICSDHRVCMQGSTEFVRVDLSCMPVALDLISKIVVELQA